MNSVNIAAIRESMTYQRGKSNNPFLILLQQPGAAEVYASKPAMDATGKNLRVLFEFLREKKQINGELKPFLNKDEVSILNASPFLAYNGFNQRNEFERNFNWKFTWRQIAKKIVDNDAIKYVLCFGDKAFKFYSEVNDGTDDSRVIIASCHIGNRGLNKAIPLDTKKKQCPQFQRLMILAEYASVKIATKKSCDIDGFKDWIMNNASAITCSFAEKLAANEELSVQCDFLEYLHIQGIV